MHALDGDALDHDVTDLEQEIQSSIIRDHLKGVTMITPGSKKAAEAICADLSLDREKYADRIAVIIDYASGIRELRYSAKVALKDVPHLPPHVKVMLNESLNKSNGKNPGGV